MERVGKSLIRCVSLAMSVMLLTTSLPLNALASGIGGIGSGGNSGGDFTGGSGGSTSSWQTGRTMGYRFTLMDNSGNVVSLFNGQPASVDMWNDKPEGNTLYFTSSKTEELMATQDTTALGMSTKNTRKNKEYKTSDILKKVEDLRKADSDKLASSGGSASDIEALSKTSELPDWAYKEGNTIVGQGAKFKTWMLADSVDGVINSWDGVSNNTSDMGGSGGSNIPSGDSGGSKPSKPSGGKPSKPAKPAKKPTTSGSTNNTTKKNTLTEAQSLKELQRLNNVVSSIGTQYINNIRYNTHHYKTMKDAIAAFYDGSQINAQMAYNAGKINSKHYKSALENAKSYRDSLNRRNEARKGKSASSINTTNTRSVASSKRFSLLDLFTITVYADEIKADDNIPIIDDVNGAHPQESNTGGGTEDDTPSADGSTKASLHACAKYLISLKDDTGNWLFDMAILHDENKNYVDPVAACAGEDYWLLVEPLLYFIPTTYTTDTKWKYGNTYIAGTVSNIAAALYELNAKGIFNDNYGSNSNYSRPMNRCAPRAMYLDVALDRGPVHLSVPSAQSPANWFDANNNTKILYDTLKSVSNPGSLDSVGYGCHAYFFKSGSAAVNTWDRTNYPDTEGPSEDPSNKPDADEYGDKANTINIVKYYQYRDELSDITAPLSYYTVTANPHTINIMDESEAGWKLVDWFTSEDDWMPESDKEPEDYPYAKSKETHKNGSYEGTEPTTLTIGVAEDDKNKTLHILLEITTPPEAGLSVVKVFKGEDGNVEKITGPTTVELTETGIYDGTEGGYSYVENKQSPEEPLDIRTWEDTVGTTESNSQIEVGDDTKTIYILYEKGAAKQAELFSNELTYNYDLRDLLDNRVLLSIYDSVPSAVQGGATKPSCGRHDCGDEDCRGNHRCKDYTGGKSLPDARWVVDVVDNHDYNSGTSFIKDYTLLGRYKANGNASWDKTKGKAAQVSPNAKFLLYRQKDKDLVTLYEGKTGGLDGSLEELGIDLGKKGYAPAATRVGKETFTEENFINTLTTHFEDGPETDRSLSWKWRIRWSSRSHTNGPTEFRTKPEEGHSVGDANALYSKAGNIKEWYFLGKANSGTEAPVDTRGSEFSGYTHNYDYQRAEADLSFYPYVKMLYRGQDDNSNAQAVGVVSENLSSMKVYNSVQLGVKKSKLPNVNLSSSQWSTHARSLSFLSKVQCDKKSVLPGGAILDLDTGKKNDTEVYARLYLTCLPDEQVGKVQTGFSTSLTEAKELATQFKVDAETSLKGYGLVQTVKQGVEGDALALVGDSEEVENGTNLGWSVGSDKNLTASTDEKYYLKQDSENTNSYRANLDVLGTSEKFTVYTAKADWDGNVWVEKDGALVGSKSKELSTLLANSEIKLLDDNTKLVSNFYNALDHGTNSSDRNRAQWYYEAFDGVSVLVADYKFEIGYGGNASKRSLVLDPKLQGELSSKSDLYNFEEETANSKVRSSMFKTRSYPTGAREESDGYLSTLMSNSTMGELEVKLSDVETLLYSRVFFVPNASVSDLN